MMKKLIQILAILSFLIILSLYISVSTTDKKADQCTLVNLNQVETTDFRKFKTVKVSASDLYESNYFKEIIQGENYRDAWSTPIDVPIIFLDTLHGGLEFIKVGGGHQTQSLQFRDNNDVKYTFRSINKNPDPLVPDFLKIIGLENIIIDGISAQHPYAAPVVAQLSQSAEILHTHPVIVFVPRQKTLDTLNTEYGNRLYFLEYEISGSRNWTSLENISNIIDTEDLLILKKELGKKLTTAKSEIIRARLFDLLIGDWDRHAKQWGWAIEKRDSNYIAHPIPTDRDNAFFDIDGLLASIMTNKNIEPRLRPFAKEIDYLNGLIYDFDIYFLQDVPKSIYLKEAKFLQSAITDSIIESALHIWNDELYDQHATEIKDKIIARRKNLLEIAKQFENLIDSKPLLTRPLNGSSMEDIGGNLVKCFDCE